jgi:Phasin protein
MKIRFYRMEKYNVSEDGDPAGPEHGQLFELGKQQTDAILKMQKELLEEYEKASRAWLSRVKSEIALWSDLATNVTASHSVPEGLDACREFASQRMQMAVEDGQRLFDEGQKTMVAITKSFNGHADNRIETVEPQFCPVADNLMGGSHGMVG